MVERVSGDRIGCLEWGSAREACISAKSPTQKSAVGVPLPLYPIVLDEWKSNPRSFPVLAISSDQANGPEENALFLSQLSPIGLSNQ